MRTPLWIPMIVCGMGLVPVAQAWAGEPVPKVAALYGTSARTAPDTLTARPASTLSGAAGSADLAAVAAVANLADLTPRADLAGRSVSGAAGMADAPAGWIDSTRWSSAASRIASGLAVGMAALMLAPLWRLRRRRLAATLASPRSHAAGSGQGQGQGQGQDHGHGGRPAAPAGSTGCMPAVPGCEGYKLDEFDELPIEVAVLSQFHHPDDEPAGASPGLPFTLRKLRRKRLGVVAAAKRRAGRSLHTLHPHQGAAATRPAPRQPAASILSAALPRR